MSAFGSHIDDIYDLLHILQVKVFLTKEKLCYHWTVKQQFTSMIHSDPSFTL